MTLARTGAYHRGALAAAVGASPGPLIPHELCMAQLAEPTTGRILVIEDDPDIRELIVGQLSSEPYSVASARNVADARNAIRLNGHDLLILDLSLPDGDGLDLCRRFRSEGFQGAIMIVTARDATMDRVIGLEVGADDYLSKPFEPRELRARVRNLFKRFQSTAEPWRRNARLARFGPWSLDLNQRRLVGSDGKLVMLSSAEYRLLMRFLQAPGKVLSREELLPERSATVAFDRSIDLQISRLRHKLTAEAGGAEVILTVRAEGYVMPGPVAFE